MVEAVFVHIPKTAGTSFRQALVAGFGEDAVSEPFAASHLSQDDADRLSRFRIIAGHISISDVERYFPNSKLFTVVRDPIDRCVSWYFYARTAIGNNSQDVVAAREHDLNDFFGLDESIIFKNIYNRHVRQLGDHVLNSPSDMALILPRAKSVLENCIWVGRQEFLNEDFSKLSTHFPELKNISVPRLNFTEGRASILEIPDKTRKNIESLNEYDSLALEKFYR